MMTRVLTDAESVDIRAAFVELFAHFFEWAWQHDQPYALVRFAFYEGYGGGDCCGAILAAAAPLAVGDELVRRHGFEWRMVERDGAFHLAVVSTHLHTPVVLDDLDRGVWNDESEDDPVVLPGEVAVESLVTILRRRGAYSQSTRTFLRRLKGPGI